MDFAEVSILLCHVPAVVFLATLDSNWIGHVLSPKFALVWLHVLPYRLLEIFVRNLAISVVIQGRKKILKGLFGNLHTPVSEVKFEFALLNEARFAHIHVDEGLAHSFPLLVNLVHDLGQQITPVVRLTTLEVKLFGVSLVVVLSTCVKNGVLF